MVQMRFVDNKDKPMGMISWFAVHPTSMNNTNKLVTSDNMGYAAILMEQKMNPGDMPGQGKFVAAFAASNLGDVSPNIMGPKCEKSGNPCDILTSACPKGEGNCFASGPGKDMFESTKIIAERIFGGAEAIFKKEPGREIVGPIKAVHQFVDMPSQTATYLNPKTKKLEAVRGCLPAMGYSFAAGTTDGPGAFNFTQGTTSENPLWNAVRNFIAEPTQDDIDCQHPKPILLATGRIVLPYEWQPKIVSTQMILIGDVALAAVPGEFTTMAGRRLRDGVKKAIEDAGGKPTQVIVAGLSNMYTDYIVTPEEYMIQRYEAASTVYGPHTHTIYMEQYKKLAEALVRDIPVAAGPTPPSLDDKLLSLVAPVVYDSAGGGRYGDVVLQPHQEYANGDVVTVKFVAGNPRNNRMHGKTFLAVEKLDEAGNSWSVIATDACWETTMTWERKSTLLGTSEAKITWAIGDDVPEGTYRIRHFGNYKYVLGGIYPYNGASHSFVVVKESENLTSDF